MPLSTEPPGSLRLEAEHQQKDFLCGPFHASRLLRDAGFEAWEGAPVNQDLVALHAATALPEGDDVSGGPPGAVSVSGVPPGAVSRNEYT